MSEEYIPFEKALAALKMTEEELKRLVSEDEIQAIRGEGGKIQLRREDVDAIKSGAELNEELVFADEDDGDDDDAGMVTAVLEDDSLLEEDETLDLSPDEIDLDEQAPARRSASAQPGPVRSRARAASIRIPSKPEGEESTLDKVLLVLSCILLIYGLFFAYSITLSQNTAATRWLSDMFRDTVQSGIGG